MNNASVQEIAYKGASFSTAMKLLGDIAANGWDPESFMTAVTTQLNGQVGSSSLVQGGLQAEQAGFQNVGTKNSGVELS